VLTSHRVNKDADKGTLVGVRLDPNLLKALDKWNAGDFSRPEAIRQIIEFALVPKPGSLVLTAARAAAVNKWADEHAPGLSLPEVLAKLIEMGLRQRNERA
jgi:hypothetical protein